MMIKKTIACVSQAHWLFVILAFGFGLAFILIVPPLWGLDEPAHFERVYQIAHGQLLPQRASKATFGGVAPKNLVYLSNYTIGDLVGNKPGFFSRKDVRSTQAYKNFTEEKFSPVNVATPSSSGYSLVAYPGPIAGVVIADAFSANIGQTLFLARLCSLFVYVVLIWLALKLLRGLKIKWLFMIVALLPAALFQGSVVTADGILISLSLLFMAILVRLLLDNSSTRGNRGLFYCLLLIGVTLPIIKFNYIFLSLMLLLVSNKVLKRKGYAIWLKICSIFIAGALGLLWLIASSAASNAPFSQRPDGATMSVTGQLSSMLHSPTQFIIASFRSIVAYGDSYTQTLISQVGWNYVNTPLVVTIGLSIVLLLAAIYAREDFNFTGRKLALMAISSLVGIASIFGVMYLAFSTVGSSIVDGVQGRYFLPFLIPLGVVISKYIPIRIEIKDSIAPYLFGLVSLIGLLFSVVYFYIVTY